MSRVFDSAGEIADAIVASVGKDVVLGLPIGIGKAVRVADALYERARNDPSISLSIFSGLTLEVPAGRSDLEKRFLGPLVERLYSEWPTPAYVSDMNRGTLPANVTVREFYLRPGAYLHNTLVQQSYTSINYSQVATELLQLGVNVIANLVAIREQSAGRYSLSSNPEVTLDLLPPFAAMRREGKGVAIVGEVNRNLPYMLGDADLAAEHFDFLLDTSDDDFPLFSLPNRAVSDGDYAAAMHVASLVRDGGTLQIGIGSLSDAVAHCLKVRHTSPELFAEVLQRLPGGTGAERRQVLPVEVAPFDEGLYSSTELMSDALYALFDADLIRRPADMSTETVMHAGFFLGSNALYDGLRTLPEARRRLIDMTSISYVNTLFGDESSKRVQRRDARFINETMMVTLLGGAVSDALDDGRVVSGVGGQFDFVSMAHSLDQGMSVLMCRARREHRGRPSSNIRWNYGHITVPRHHRDVFVTEYGVAATRGCSDRNVIDRLLHIADAEFHENLVKAARDSGKLERGYTMARDADQNRPATIASVFNEHRSEFPPYPLGTELTADEQALAKALGWLKASTASVGGKMRTVLQAGLANGDTMNESALDRMGLGQPSGIRQRALRRLLGYALKRTSQ